MLKAKAKNAYHQHSWWFYQAKAHNNEARKPLRRPGLLCEFIQKSIGQQIIVGKIIYFQTVTNSTADGMGSAPKLPVKVTQQPA